MLRPLISERICISSSWLYFSCVLSTDNGRGKCTNSASMLTHTRIRQAKRSKCIYPCALVILRATYLQSTLLKISQCIWSLQLPFLPGRTFTICRGWIEKSCSFSTQCDIQPHSGLSLHLWCNSIFPLDDVLSGACLVHKRSMMGSRIIHFFFPWAGAKYNVPDFQDLIKLS